MTLTVLPVTPLPAKLGNEVFNTALAVGVVMLGAAETVWTVNVSASELGLVLLEESVWLAVMV